MITLMMMMIMMVLILWYMKSMKLINTLHWQKGQQKIEQMQEIQKIVTSAGWLDQCPGGPPSLNFERIEPEKLHLQSGMHCSRTASTGLI